MMPSAQTDTHALVQQAAGTQGHAHTANYQEAANNPPEQENHGQEDVFQQGMQQAPYHNHNHPAATNATNMLPVTTAQDLIRNGQYPANFTPPQQQPESRWARDRQLPIPSYARSTWNEFNAFRSGGYTAQELEPERPRGDQQILYYNPTAGEPIHMPGYVDPEYTSACEYLTITPSIFSFRALFLFGH
jgi:hypothetical protein